MGSKQLAQGQYSMAYQENKLDARIEQFDRMWRTGAIPAIVDFLSRDSSDTLSAVERHDLLIELVMVDMEYRWRRATSETLGAVDPAQRSDQDENAFPVLPHVEDYARVFPELHAADELTTVIAGEYRVRHRWGDRPTHDEYARRFPTPGRMLSEALRDVDRRLPAPSERVGLRVRCPHCDVPIVVADAVDLSRHITCTSCERRFSVIGEDHATERFAAGRRLGSFELLQRLGSGSFGTVWKARDTRLDREVALKIPHRDQLQPELVEQFFHEAQMSARLNHPYIVQIYEAGRDQDTLFVVGDLVDGVPLSRWLSGRRLSAREAAVLCQRITQALSHAHEMGVIHRDLKPHNIIMDSNGQPHLTDFGLARRETGEATITRDGQLLGTPAYMSPEQAAGKAHRADQRSDIYSVGVILYELLTGERPFRGSLRMLLQQVVYEDALSPRKLRSSISKDLETICLTCLEKDPGKRFATARELADELQRFLDGRPIHARPISTVTRSVRWCKRNPGAAAAVGLLLFVATASPVVAITQRRAAERYRWQLYASDMKVASAAWESANVDHARNVLLQHVPRGRQKDLRGFEWFYLWRLCQSTAAVPTFPLQAPAWLAPSPDGKTLAATGRGRLRLWNLETGREQMTLDAHFSLAPGLAFSPSGQILATAGWDGTLQLWRPRDSKEPIILMKGQPGVATKVSFNDLAFSPDGNLLASNGPGSEVLLWDVDKRTIVRRLRGHASEVWCIAFSPSGHLASASRDGNVRLWNVDSGALMRSLDAQEHGEIYIAFSPNGTTLVSGTEDSMIKLWDVATGEFQGSWRAHHHAITSVSCSPDGETLASASRDGTVKLWNMHTQEALATLRGHGGSVLDVAFTPDGKIVASAGLNGSVKLWDVSEATKKQTLEGQRVAYSVQDGALMSWNRTGVLKLWDATTGELKAELLNPTEGCVAQSPRGNRLALGHPDGTVELLVVATGENRTLTPRHNGPVRLVLFSPDRRYLASIGPTLKLWDLSTFTLITDLEVYWGADPCFSPDSKTLATVSQAADAEVYAVNLWDLTGRQLASLPQQDPIFCLSFSDDGTLLAAGSWSGEIQLWDVRTRTQLLTPLKGHTGIVYSIDFSPDKRRLASSSRDRTVKLWDVATGDEMITLKGHARRVTSVAFSPTGTTLASASEDDTVIQWRAARKKEVEVVTARNRSDSASDR